MSNKRINISSGSQFEKSYGYSRAVLVGNQLTISGTIGMDFQSGYMPADAVSQLRQIVKNFEFALGQAGGNLRDIVQLTTYVTSPEIFSEIGPEMGKIFCDILPTNAALVIAFPIEGILVEMSATAIIGCGEYHDANS